MPAPPDQSSLHLRMATPEDIPTLQTLMANSIRLNCSSHYTPGQIDGCIAVTIGRYDPLIHSSTYFVLTSPSASNQDEVVACGGWSFRRTVYSAGGRGELADEALDPEVDAAWIRGIYVHPSWTRRGLGSRLTLACEEAAGAAGFRRFALGSSLNAVPLYESLGYEGTGEEAVTLPNGEEMAMKIMRKDLTPKGGSQ